MQKIWNEEDFETSVSLTSEHEITLPEASDDLIVLPAEPQSIYEIYKKYRKKIHKKTKKKKGNKHKKNRDFPYVHPRYVPDLFAQQVLHQSAVIREGNNVPNSILFNQRYESAFFFGRTLGGGYVGKPQNKDGHIAIFGGTGSGKSKCIAIPTMHTWRGSIFTFDFKGDLIEWAKGKKTKVLYMLKGQNNLYWYDPFYFLHQDGKEYLVQNARELTEAIIPQPLKENPFWSNSARELLTGAIVYYFNLGLGFIDAMTEIKTTKTSDLLIKIHSDELAARCVNPDLDSSPQMLAGIIAELHLRIAVFATDPLIRDALSPSDDTDDVPKEMIRWQDLESSSVFIRLDQSKIQQWGGVMRLMLIQLMRTLERRPEKYSPEGENIKPTLLMLDEFPLYGKVDIITSTLRTLRSKNVTCSLFCQSVADLDMVYGSDIRRVILDNCNYKVIFNASERETQRNFSDLVGTVNVLNRALSTNYDELGLPSGYSFTMRESREPVIHPHEFASLTDIVLLHPEGFSRIKKETYFIEKAKYNALLAEH